MAFTTISSSSKFACSSCRKPTTRSPCLARSSRSRQHTLRCAAILSGPQRSVSEQQPTRVVVKASESDAAVPLPPPEPERQPPLDASWFDALVESSIKAPINAYNNALKARPLLTKACTSLVGFVLGDLIAQVSFPDRGGGRGCLLACWQRVTAACEPASPNCCSHKQQHLPRHTHTHALAVCCCMQHFSHPGAVDVLRAMRLGAYGFFIDGPVGSKWYDILEQYVYPQEQTSTKAVIAKTALDQVIYATIMTGGAVLLGRAVGYRACICVCVSVCAVHCDALRVSSSSISQVASSTTHHYPGLSMHMQTHACTLSQQQHCN